MKIIDDSHETHFRYDGLDRRVGIVEKKNGVEQSNLTFIWDGTEIAQRRDSSGATIERNYFSNGFSAHSQSPELVEGTPSAVHHYYYTKDHLGSIREVVASDGTTVEAVYDYSPWGEVTKTGGTGVESDFLYTGHYFHEASDLHLTLYRAYNPELGMWLSRDPIAENGGINLYAYVGNNPINYWDPYGLRLNPFATALRGLGTLVAVDAATPDPSDIAAPAKGLGYGIATGLLTTGYAAWEIGEWLLNRNKACGGDDCPEWPPFVGKPGSTVKGEKQTRRYGDDGFPETDVDTGHDHGAGDPHSHDCGRPSGGGRPSHHDRGPGRPISPSDPPAP